MRRSILRGVVLASLVLLTACKTELYAGLPEAEANQMLAVLLHHGISASKQRLKDGSEALSVEKAQFADAVDLLREGGYPRKSFETIGDVFKPSGLIPSPMQERVRFLWALGQELSQTISNIDGVLTARVQVVLPDDSLLNREPTPSSASVFVRYKAGSNVDRLTPQIKELVASSVPGLSYDKVSLIMVPVVAPVDTPLPAPSNESSDILLSAVGGGMGAILLLGLGVWLMRLRADRDRRPRWLHAIIK